MAYLLIPSCNSEFGTQVVMVVPNMQSWFLKLYAHLLYEADLCSRTVLAVVVAYSQDYTCAATCGPQRDLRSPGRRRTSKRVHVGVR